MANLTVEMISRDANAFLDDVDKVREQTQQTLEDLNTVLELAARGKKASSPL